MSVKCRLMGTFAVKLPIVSENFVISRLAAVSMRAPRTMEVEVTGAETYSHLQHPFPDVSGDVSFYSEGIFDGRIDRKADAERSRFTSVTTAVTIGMDGVPHD